MKKYISTNAAPQAIGAYSQAICVNGTLYCSGQIALDPQSGELVSGGIEPQTKQVLANINAVLVAAGFSEQNVVKTTIFLTNMSDFAVVNALYGEYFVSRPARSCVAVAGLPRNAAIEIEVLAKAEI